MATLGVQVVVMQADQVLLIQREDWQVWALPGGSIDPGESAAQAAVREVKEESGFDIVLERMVGLYAMPDVAAIGQADHAVVFSGRVISGSLLTATNETLNAAFFALDSLPETLVWHHRIRIQDATAGYGGSMMRRQHFGPGFIEQVQQLVDSGVGLNRSEMRAVQEKSGERPDNFFLRIWNHPGDAIDELNS
jgi:8-oxo-dGTP diphosphatase